MSYEIYKVLHLLGLSLVVLSLGGIILHAINGGSKQSNSFRKGVPVSRWLRNVGEDGYSLVSWMGYGKGRDLVDLGRFCSVGL